MTRKYTKRNTAYWNSKKKAKVKYGIKKSDVIFHDKGKNSSITIIANLKDPIYRHKKS